MKDLKELLNSAVDEIKLTNGLKFDRFLTEESDFVGTVIAEADDPFGGDAGPGGDPFGGDASNDAGGDVGGDAGGDPFGGDAGGGAAGGDAGAGAAGGDAANGENAEGENEENKDGENPALTDGSHEQDPEFSQGTTNSDDVTLPDVPAAKSKFDIEGIMSTVMSVIQTCSEDQLVEMDKVKNCVELIFNGFKLNNEDLEFNNLKNAIFLIKKIADKLDITARSYLNRKLKEPLIKKRDDIKQKIAAQKGDLQNTRDILTSLDLKK